MLIKHVCIVNQMNAKREGVRQREGDWAEEESVATSSRAEAAM